MKHWVPLFLIRPVLLRSRIREHISNSLAKAVWGHWEVIGIGEPTSDQKLRPIVAVRGHCGLGSLFVEQMFKFENLFILVVWIFPLFSILLSLTADNWVRKVCVPSILSLEFSKLGVPLFLMIAVFGTIECTAALLLAYTVLRSLFCPWRHTR